MKIQKECIHVKVKPSSSTSEILGEKDGVLQVSLKSPPEDGKANKELLKLLWKKYKQRYIIKSGLTSREKLLERM